VSYGMNSRSVETAYVPEIDGLRALAVVSVMIYHVVPALVPGGFTGVDVFFVISGYVVTQSLARDSAKPIGRYLVDFYSRRIIRILPALLACLLVTSVLTTLLIPNSWLSNTTQTTGLYAFFGLSNVALLWNSDGYFAPRAEFNPFLHTWSLGVEEQFYLVFPLACYVWLKLRERQGSAQLVGNWLLVFLALASIVYCAGISATEPERAFYRLPSRFWELALGALLFQLHWRNVAVANSAAWSARAVLLGFLAIGLSLAASGALSFPFPGALLAVAGTLLVIAGVPHSSRAGASWTSWLRKPVVVGVGRLSYSLYLWHWPIYTLFRWTVGLESVFAIAAAVILTFVAASLSFRFLESPIRQSGVVRRQPRLAIVCVGLLSAGLGWAVADEVFTAQPRLSLSVTSDAETWYASERNRAVQMPRGCRSEARSRQLNDFLWVIAFERTGCESGGSSQAHQLFVAGDSHAEAYTRMLRRYADEHGVNVWLFRKGGCPIANLLQPSASLSTDCQRWLHAVLANIDEKAKPGDLVFLASMRAVRFGDQWVSFDIPKQISEQSSPQAREAQAQAYAETAQLLTALERRGLKIVVDAPKPMLMSPPFRCSDWFNAKNPICARGLTVNREFSLANREPVVAALRSLQQQDPGLIVWDPFVTLCPADPCSAFDGDRPMFFDGDHLSGHGNDVLYPQFAALLNTVWPAAKIAVTDSRVLSGGRP
jgi:peptidoglycan/LPS O-acetylase OafA/YrhL